MRKTSTNLKNEAVVMKYGDNVRDIQYMITMQPRDLGNGTTPDYWDELRNTVSKILEWHIVHIL